MVERPRPEVQRTQVCHDAAAIEKGVDGGVASSLGRTNDLPSIVDRISGTGECPPQRAQVRHHATTVDEGVTNSRTVKRVIARCAAEAYDLASIVDAQCLATAPAQRAKVCHDAIAIEKSIVDSAAGNLRIAHCVAAIIQVIGNAVDAAEGAEVSNSVLLREAGARSREQAQASRERDDRHSFHWRVLSP